MLCMSVRFIGVHELTHAVSSATTTLMHRLMWTETAACLDLLLARHCTLHTSYSCPQSRPRNYAYVTLFTGALLQLWQAVLDITGEEMCSKIQLLYIIHLRIYWDCKTGFTSDMLLKLLALLTNDSVFPASFH